LLYQWWRGSFWGQLSRRQGYGAFVYALMHDGKVRLSCSSLASNSRWRWRCQTLHRAKEWRPSFKCLTEVEAVFLSTLCATLALLFLFPGSDKIHVIKTKTSNRYPDGTGRCLGQINTCLQFLCRGSSSLLHVLRMEYSVTAG
jgi:hypothetical protein